MKRSVFAVKDLAADLYGQPMFVPSKGVAIRSFTDEVNRADSSNQLFNHPSDFDLYHLGSFDDSIGQFDTVYPPVLVVRGNDVKVSG